MTLFNDLSFEQVEKRIKEELEDIAANCDCTCDEDPCVCGCKCGWH